MSITRRLDRLLNSLTTYRLVTYGLGILLAVGIGLSALGALTLSVKGLCISTVILLPICYVSNRLLGEAYHAARNNESWLITALILCCILPPATTKARIVGAALAGLLSMATKYLLALYHHHIFNPAAIAVFIVGMLGLSHASWWIGSPSMLPFTLLFGFLIVRKIHRIQLVLAFGAAALTVMLLVGLQHNLSVLTILATSFTSWPLVFFGTVMLTEPATMPSSHRNQLLYGLVVGALFSAQIRIGIFSTAPETVLVLGNLFAYISEPRHKLILTLKAKYQLAPLVYDYVFQPDRQLQFTAGQYLEWTLPHGRVDSRGNRRSFTIASSPTEKDIHMGVKFYEPSSSFKSALLTMEPGQKVVADQLAGNFCLPKDIHQKLVFIAGGIGITPFRSMLQQLIDDRQPRDIVLVYVVKNAQEAVYQDVIMHAKSQLKLRVIHVVSEGQLPNGSQGYAGRLSAEQLHTEISDYHVRQFYISGPNAMVEAYSDMLRRANVPRNHIVKDYFSGY